METQVIESAQETEAIVKELAQANKDLDTFLYKASHDLKGPLATLEGLCNLGLVDCKDEQAVIYFQHQRKVIQKMQLLLFRIIEIGNIRNHKPEIKPIKMYRFAKSIVKSMHRESGASHIQFFLEFPEDLVVEGDVEMLEIVMDNILKNAIQHADYAQKESTPEVHLSYEEDIEYHQIHIRDNGSGIDLNIADKVFDMFFRGNDYFKGFGLGLYKAKIAIDKLKGNIQLTQTNHTGTTFTIFLPKNYHIL